jgi:hypothetical protein
MVDVDSDTAGRMKKFLETTGIQVPDDLRERIAKIARENIQFRIFPEPTKNSVILEFSTGVNYIGFTPEQARKVARNLVDCAIEIERKMEKDARKSG